MQTTNDPPLFFNKNVVPQTILQKNLGMFLESKLNFSEHLKETRNSYFSVTPKAPSQKE